MLSENGNQNRAGLLGLVAALLFAVPAAAEVPAELRTQAQQVVSVIDYVAADYPRAVKDGVVLEADEFEEQKGLLTDATGLAGALSAAGGAFDARPAIEALARQVEAKASGADVAGAVGALREQLVKAYEIATAPKQLPDATRGKELWAVACASCHGLDGRSETDVAKEQDPPPANFHEAERMAALSPFRAFNAITWGVSGTAMPSYDVFDETQRWDLAAYLFTLRHAGMKHDVARNAARKAALALHPLKLATHTDGDLLARLAERGLQGEEAMAALAEIRTGLAYREPSRSDLYAVRRTFEEAVAKYAQGDRVGAKSAALTAYLEGFEPKEPALRARDGELVSEIEASFTRFRGGIEKGVDLSEVKAEQRRLDTLLARTETAGEGRASSQVAFWGSLVIVLREGLEAALLVATLLALVRRSGRPEQARAAHAGWIGALGLGVVVWFASGALIEGSGARRELIEGSIQLITAAFLLYASHWLLARAHAAKWVGILKDTTTGGGSAAAVAGLSFLAVFREAFEVVVFYRGLLIETGEVGAMWLGAGVGAVVLLIVVLGFMRVGKRLPLGPFLTACGLLLCLLAVVMTGHGIAALQEADLLPLSVLGFSVRTLGIHGSVEGLVAQVVLLVGIVGSWLWSRSQPAPGAPPRPATTPAS